ncbi:hypothetical protein D3C76_1247490 [compost metagenome]
MFSLMPVSFSNISPITASKSFRYTVSVWSPADAAVAAGPAVAAAFPSAAAAVVLLWFCPPQAVTASSESAPAAIPAVLSQFRFTID